MASQVNRKNNTGITFSIDDTTCKGKTFLKFFINSSSNELYEGFISITGDDDTSVQYTQKMINFIRNKNPESLRLGQVTVFGDHFEVETAGASCNFNCSIKCDFDFAEIRRSLFDLLLDRDLLDISGLNRRYQTQTFKQSVEPSNSVQKNKKQVVEPLKTFKVSEPLMARELPREAVRKVKCPPTENQIEATVKKNYPKKSEQTTEKTNDFVSNINFNSLFDQITGNKTPESSKSGQSDNNNLSGPAKFFSDLLNKKNTIQEKKSDDSMSNYNFNTLFDQIGSNEAQEFFKFGQSDNSSDPSGFFYNLLNKAKDEKQNSQNLTPEKKSTEPLRWQTFNFGDSLDRKLNSDTAPFCFVNQNKNVFENKPQENICNSSDHKCDDQSNILNVLLKELFKQQQ